jgi:hypothetical protein
MLMALPKGIESILRSYFLVTTFLEKYDKAGVKAKMQKKQTQSVLEQATTDPDDVEDIDGVDSA